MVAPRLLNCKASVKPRFLPRHRGDSYGIILSMITDILKVLILLNRHR